MSAEVLGQLPIEYGEVYKVKIGWYNWVAINSPEAMREIFDKQSKWRAYRTVVHGLLSTSLTDRFNPSQLYETKQLLYDFTFNNQDGKRFCWHVWCSVFTISTTSCYGSRVDGREHEDVRSAIHSTQLLSKISKPGSLIADEFPILGKLPASLQPGRRTAELLRAPILSAKMRPWRRLGDRMKAGRAPVCFGRKLCEDKKLWRDEGLPDKDFAWIVGGIADAGSGTSTVTLNLAFLYN
ncbi:cytochrome P450 [Xylaria grammica]|nr:cytochrome P450 [Xylaria grammica]